MSTLSHHKEIYGVLSSRVRGGGYGADWTRYPSNQPGARLATS